jgi:hypothetical protein
LLFWISKDIKSKNPVGSFNMTAQNQIPKISFMNDYEDEEYFFEKETRLVNIVDEQGNVFAQRQAFKMFLLGHWYNVYYDEKGYFRSVKTDNLVHRAVAYTYIYLRYSADYEWDFKDYEVHHADGIKEHNHQRNLEVLTPDEHDARHRR